MKKFFVSFLVVFAVFFLTLSLFTNNDVNAASEQIKNFKTEIEVLDTGTLNVRETITYDFSTNKKRGIYRDIKVVFENQDGIKQETPLTITRVTDGKNVDLPYKISRKNDAVSVRIGDPDIYISGVHDYKIYYAVDGAIEQFLDHDEIFWNSTGNEWDVIILNAQTTIKLPGNTPPKELKLDCFTGISKSTQKNCEKVQLGKNTFSYNTTKPLLPGEGMSVVMGFEKGFIRNISTKTNVSETSIGSVDTTLVEILIIFGLILWYILLPIGIVMYAVFYGKDPKPAINTIPVLFEPPTDDNGNKLSPAEVGTLTDEVVDDREITATIVDLAIRGHLTISEDKEEGFVGKISEAFSGKNFIFSLKPVDQVKDKAPLKTHEVSLLGALFSENQIVSTKSLRSTSIFQDSFAKKVQKIKKSLYKEMFSQGYFPHNPENIRTTWMVFGILAFMTINPIAGITAIIVSRFIPKKTLKGVDAMNRSLGLKKFLNSQERQLEFQEESWYLFEKLLPYAITFGVTKTWAKRFEHLNADPNSNWYQGAQTYNAVALSSSLGNFGTTFSSVSSVRSSSGHSSGFGGGGFSGGGFGGGGGGGSW